MSNHKNSFDEMIIRIDTDIELVQEMMDRASRIWIGNQDGNFKSLLDEAGRVHGALLAALLRQKTERIYFRDNPEV